MLLQKVCYIVEVRNNHRGIVIISVLVLTLLATFFLGALIQMNPSRLRKVTHSETRERAVAAAHAGIDYALHRLHQDLEWRADANTVVVQTDDLVVLEDEGNVLGWIRTEQGPWSHFRLRFNYQDGTDTTDGYLSPQYPLDLPGISVNNLTNANSTPIPLGNGPGFAYTGQHGFEIPEFTVALLVEGVVGSDLTPLQPMGQIGDRVAARRVVEGIYQVTRVGRTPSEGAVLMASGNSNFVVGNAAPGAGDHNFSGMLRLAANDQVARMRTKGRSSLTLGEGKLSPYLFYPDMNSEVAVGFGGFSPTTRDGQEFSVLNEADDPFLEVAWDKVSRSEQADPIELPAGVYTFEQPTPLTSSAGGATQVKYYPMTWDAYREARLQGQDPPSSQVPDAFADRVQLNGKTWTDSSGVSQQRHLVTFEKDVEVQPVSGISDLVIVPAQGARPARAQWGNEVFNEGGRVWDPNTQTYLLPGDEPGVPPGPTYEEPYFVEGTGGGGGGGEEPTPDPIEPEPSPDDLSGGIGFSTFIPATDNFSDSTLPQDIELVFAPDAGKSAAIRTTGNVFMGTHLSGSGGAIVAGGGIDLVGFGIDLHAGLGERDGIALYAQEDIRISTYDPGREKYWDVAIKGVIFTKGDLLVQLGESAPSDSNRIPTWGTFDYMGAIIALGRNSGILVEPSSPAADSPTRASPGATGSNTSNKGNAKVSAEGIRLFYEPKFLAPYVEDTDLVPAFAPISVYVR